MSTITPLVLQLLYSKSPQVVSVAGGTLKLLCHHSPVTISALLFNELQGALNPSNLIHVHKLPAVIGTLASAIRYN